MNQYIQSLQGYKFWYDYTKDKYNKKTKFCFIDRDCFRVHIKTEDFYENIAKDVEEWV